ncbi:DUF4360 domain-containing protein [Rhizobium sp.]
MKSLKWTTFLIVAAGLGPAEQAHAGNGCADGTYSMTLAPDGNAVSFLFNDLFATSDTGAGNRRTRCRVSAPVTEGKGYSVFAIDYRGFAVKDKDQSVTLSERRNRLLDPTGRYARDFQISERMGTKNSRSLDLSLLLMANGNPGDAEAAEIYLDSIDISRIGFTTDAAVSQSLDALAAQRREIIARAYSASSQILGIQAPLGAQDYVSAFTGSDGTSGIRAKWSVDDAISFTGGIAYLAPSGSRVDAEGSLLLAAAARYTQPLDTAWSVFGELGAWGSPNLDATYLRSYMNGDTLISSQNQASGSLLGIHALMGLAYAPDSANEIAVSARLARSMFNVASYSEDGNANNLFAARLSGRTTTSDTADLMVMWTRIWSPDVETSVYASLGQEFGNDDAVHAKVDWVGKANGGWDSRYFGTAGARLGWNFQENWALDTTAGVTLREDEDADWNFGLALKAKF